MIINEMGKALVEDAARVLESAKRHYEWSMQTALRTLRSAHTDLVCFGINYAMLHDGQLESDIMLAMDAEKFYNAAKANYDDVIIRFVW